MIFQSPADKKQADWRQALQPFIVWLAENQEKTSVRELEIKLRQLRQTAKRAQIPRHSRPRNLEPIRHSVREIKPTRQARDPLNLISDLRQIAKNRYGIWGDKLN